MRLNVFFSEARETSRLYMSVYRWQCIRHTRKHRRRNKMHWHWDTLVLIPWLYLRYNVTLHLHSPRRVLKIILALKTWGFLVVSLCDDEGHELLFLLAYNIERRNWSSLRKLEMLWPNALFGNSESLAKEETYPYITSWSESLDCARI